MEDELGRNTHSIDNSRDTQRNTERIKRDEVFGKEQDGDRYTEEKMERYIQEIYKIEGGLRENRTGRGRWKLGVGR